MTVVDVKNFPIVFKSFLHLSCPSNEKNFNVKYQDEELKLQLSLFISSTAKSEIVFTQNQTLLSK